MKVNLIQRTIGLTLSITFFLLAMLIILTALHAFLGQLPGYPIFFVSCLALTVFCYRLAFGKKGAVISVQCFAVVGIVGVFLDGRNYQDPTNFIVFLLPLVAAVICAQVIRIRTRKAELNDGEMA